MGDMEFHDKVDKMFESRLERHVIRIELINKISITAVTQINLRAVLKQKIVPDLTRHLPFNCLRMIFFSLIRSYLVGEK